jgi:methionyl-tRNA formyltransferase
VRVIFAGTPPFAAKALFAIHAAGFSIPVVLTQPDRPAGRGKALRASAVKELAQQMGLSVFQPLSLKPTDVQQTLADFDADVMVVAAYGLILPKVVLELPKWGCLNIHASLLPRWRGAAPIQRAIQAGDSQTGITVMQMDVGLDTGPMIAKRSIAIDPTQSAAQLQEQLAILGSDMIVQTLFELQSTLKTDASPSPSPSPRPRLPSTEQPIDGVTYAAKLEKSESWIDWSQSAQTISRQIFAFDPVPGSTTALKSTPDQMIKIWRVQLSTGIDLPDIPMTYGEFQIDSRSRVFVACGDGLLELLEVQKPGGRRITAQAWAAGLGLSVGTKNTFLLSLGLND